MTCLNTQAFLATKPALKRERVDLPELGPEAYVWARELTALERSQLNNTINKGDDEDAPRRPSFDIRLVLAGTVTDEGEKLFTAAHGETLATYPASLIERIAEPVARLSGLIAPKKGEDAKGN